MVELFPYILPSDCAYQTPLNPSIIPMGVTDEIIKACEWSSTANLAYGLQIWYTIWYMKGNLWHSTSIIFNVQYKPISLFSINTSEKQEYYGIKPKSRHLWVLAVWKQTHRVHREPNSIRESKTNLMWNIWRNCPSSPVLEKSYL